MVPVINFFCKRNHMIFGCGRVCYCIINILLFIFLWNILGLLSTSEWTGLPLFKRQVFIGAGLYGLCIFQAIMDTWTRQMGFPLITISREGNTITATQKRFILTVNISSETEQASNESVSPFGYKWYVPLSYYTNQHTRKVHHIWMNMSNGKIINKLGSYLFLCNIQDCIKDPVIN
jgi:hypothetical protein